MKNRYRRYPVAHQEWTGCKVGWKIYKTRAEAEKCSEAAKHNARIALSEGYDFGYQSPGWIETMEDGRFKVCIP